ncbi:MAG: SDR family oxidoreductase [Candidatus Lokiarchaeota archaeon]|nr:SDR family oxidoreductase [Candidatus Lokiarchaeota archaeon]
MSNIMELKGRNVLVTGAAGFIGSHLADRLLAEGARVTGIDNLSEGSLENLKKSLQETNFKFHKGDIRDREFLHTIVDKIDIIFHLAAFTSVRRSISNPLECNEINVTGTLNLLELARKYDVNKFIYSSSAAVYGNTPQLPIDEDVQPKPLSPYGISKLTAEQYVLIYNELYDIETTALRYFNVYGPRQKLSEYSGVITIFLERLKNHQDLVIYGDGNQTRDFIYITDVVNANLKATKTKSQGNIFNIATGDRISIRELAEIIVKQSGKSNTKIIHDPPKLGDIIHSYANIEKSRQKLDFSAQISINEGLRKVIQWYMKN